MRTFSKTVSAWKTLMIWKERDTPRATTRHLRQPRLYMGLGLRPGQGHGFGQGRGDAGMIEAGGAHGQVVEARLVFQVSHSQDGSFHATAGDGDSTMSKQQAGFTRTEQAGNGLTFGLGGDDLGMRIDRQRFGDKLNAFLRHGL